MSRLDSLRNIPKAPSPPTRVPRPPVAPVSVRVPQAPIKPKPAPIKVEMDEVEELPMKQLVELKPLDHATDRLNPIAEMEDKVRQMLASGSDETLVAVQCGVTLSKVFEIRRGVQPAQVGVVTNRPPVSVGPGNMPSAKEVFANRMNDFNECLEIAIQEYKNDPQSEANYSAMNGFMKTLNDLFKAYQDLDDPQETSERLVKQIVFPFMQSVIRLNVESFRDIVNDVGQGMVQFQREQLADGLKDALKKMNDLIRSEFNRAVKTLEEIYGVKMDSLYMRPKAPGAKDETDEVKSEAA